MRRSEKSAAHRLARPADIVASATAAMVLFGMSTAPAATPPGSCPTVITSCGCTITKADIYTVANDLSSSQTSKPNCIEIAASYSILNLKGFSIIGAGDGTGIGILIRKEAEHVVVEGGDEGNTTPPDDAGANDVDFPSAQAVVTQWDIAIQDNGDGAVIGLFKDLGGNIFQQNFGNATAGIFINGAKRSIAKDFHASYNGKDGVMLKNASDVRLSNFSATGNHETGVSLESSGYNTIATASAASNGTYGMLLFDSSHNAILDCNGTSGNGDTGILVGCGTGEKCTGNKRSDGNRIANSGAPGNTLNGIVIEKGNSNNIVSITHNDGNPDMHDMVDLNPHCSSNIWYNNTGTASQSCIH